MPPRRPPPLGLDRRHRDGLVFGRWVRRVRLGRPFLLGLADFLVRLSLAFGHDRFLDGARSEEHTSELQSLMRISYAVFCLKKKNQRKQRRNTNSDQTCDQSKRGTQYT